MATAIVDRKPLTTPMVRAMVSMRNNPLEFEGKCFRLIVPWSASMAGKHAVTVMFKLPVVLGLEARGLAWIMRRKGGIVRAGPTRAGRAMLRYTPQTCVGCGCTDSHACPEVCSWRAPGWCSACDDAKAGATP